MSGFVVEIRVAGSVQVADAEQLADLQVRTTSTTTVLVGTVGDQAALVGLLARLREMGLEVEELRRVTEGEDEQAG